MKLAPRVGATGARADAGRSRTAKPALRFFNELDARDLGGVFTDGVVDQLVSLGAGVTMGLRDDSRERADVVRGLTARGVSVGAWLLLPRAEGYFATHDNAPLVERRYAAFHEWALREGLRFEAVGLDFEPDLRELDRLVTAPLRTLGGWVWRARRGARSRAALERYRGLVARIRADGHRVETYQLPTVLDGRAGGAAVHRVLGSVDVEVDREVLMLYSSLLGWLGPGLLASYARQCRAVGVGSTGGGVDPMPKLAWPELERDLLLAARACDDVSIFSLEGCVWQGFLPRLLELDWSRAPTLSAPRRVAAGAVRGALRVLSRAGRAAR